MKELSKLTDRELLELNFSASMLILSDLNHLKQKLLPEWENINFSKDHEINFGLINQTLNVLKAIKISDDGLRTL
ncbi:hypothetical protein MCERE19_04083 [Spirosomataceae bacterium]|jgi:hypothetical protein